MAKSKSRSREIALQLLGSLKRKPHHGDKREVPSQSHERFVFSLIGNVLPSPFVAEVEVVVVSTIRRLNLWRPIGFAHLTSLLACFAIDLYVCACFQ